MCERGGGREEEGDCVEGQYGDGGPEEEVGGPSHCYGFSGVARTGVVRCGAVWRVLRIAAQRVRGAGRGGLDGLVVVVAVVAVVTTTMTAAVGGWCRIER